MEQTLTCPKCGSTEVTATEETKWIVNTGEHYCNSVKWYDQDAEATCLGCHWVGKLKDLVVKARVST